MGLVSFVCTLLVVAIILIAVALSTSGHPRNTTRIRPSEVVYLVPPPRKFVNRSPTIVVHKHNARIWQKHVEDLSTLMRAYRDRQGTLSTSNCDLHYAPIGVSSCSFPLDKISENCTAQNNFGYDTGSPCVALVFNAFSGWTPIPYNVSNPSEIPPEVRKDYDPHLMRITCRTTVVSSNSSMFVEVQYSPFPGFPLRFLPSRGMGSSLPPLVMVQFLGTKPVTDVDVRCTLWAKNLPRNTTADEGSIRFSLYVV
ncbi:Sodium/potassium-transporting ATPase subunit beta, partial [Stegodyphus mimosarum]